MYRIFREVHSTGMVFFVKHFVLFSSFHVRAVARPCLQVFGNACRHSLHAFAVLPMFLICDSQLSVIQMQIS